MKYIITIISFLSFQYGILLPNSNTPENNSGLQADSTQHEIHIENEDSISYVRIEDNENEEDEVFIIVEEMPQFNGGGPEKFKDYIYSELKYPSIALNNGISGRVFVQFVVDKEGNVTNVKILRSVDPILDKEALRIIRSSPKWIPGKQRGNPVNVQFVYPVTFILE